MWGSPSQSSAGQGFVGDGSGEVGPDGWEGVEGVRAIFIPGNR